MLLFFVVLVPGFVSLVLVAWKMHVAEPTGQHAGAGDGALTVEQLCARVQRDRELIGSTGRHALRDAVLSVVV